MKCLLILTVISAILWVTYGTPQNEPDGEVAQSEPTSISIPLSTNSTSNTTIISTPVQNPVNPIQQPATENVTSVAPTPLPNQLPAVPVYPNQVPYGMPYTPSGMYYLYNPFVAYPQPYGVIPHPQYQQGPAIPYQFPGQYPQYQIHFPNSQLPYQVPSPVNATNKSTIQTIPETAQQNSLTPIITSSTGEVGSDINSLPPQVKEFMDMIPQILSMHEKQEQPPAPTPHSRFPFGLRKHPKAPLLFKRKPYYPEDSIYNKYPYLPELNSGTT